MFCRLESVRNRTCTPRSTCQWMPAEVVPCWPPTFISNTVLVGEFASSTPYLVCTSSLSPTCLVGQWHCSQVSRAGRRLWTGLGIGVGYRCRATDTICHEPEIFDFTNQSAPGPMWQSAQRSLLCDERWKAVCSGSITVWQTVPQNGTDSITSTPL